MKLFVQATAEEDVLLQVEWYASQGAPNVARRFYLAVTASLEALMANPGAGAPKETANPKLSGLRTWTIKGFKRFRIYYILGEERLQVVRILHGMRDIGSILEEEDADDPSLH